MGSTPTRILPSAMVGVEPTMREIASPRLRGAFPSRVVRLSHYVSYRKHSSIVHYACPYLSNRASRNFDILLFRLRLQKVYQNFVTPSTTNRTRLARLPYSHSSNGLKSIPTMGIGNTPNGRPIPFGCPGCAWSTECDGLAGAFPIAGGH